MHTTVAGYTYGTEEIASSPLSMEDLSLLKQTVLFTEEDGHNTSVRQTIS